MNIYDVMLPQAANIKGINSSLLRYWVLTSAKDTYYLNKHRKKL